MEEKLKQAPVTPETSDIIRIAVYGPESTGKTTLAAALAAHYDTTWAPEFARDYLQQKWNATQTVCEPEDLMPIAIGQTALENERLSKARRFFFADTCLLVTKVYSEIYYGYCDPVIDKAARKHKYDLFFLTDIDVPWEKDDLRDRPDDRGFMFEKFRNALAYNHKPYIVLSGSPEERLATATDVLAQYEMAKRLGFSAHDFVQLHQRGVRVEDIAHQLRVFREGIAKMRLERPATEGHGILRFSEGQMAEYAAAFDARKPDLELVKFVPASGAASRMFKFLSEFLNDFDPREETINAYINRKGDLNLSVFLAGIEKFPFYADAHIGLARLYPDFESWEQDKKHYYFIKMMLEPGHFDFCNLPKGVLPFHRYDGHVATAVEEHLNETVHYSNGKGNLTRLHFTVTEKHRELFERAIDKVRSPIESSAGTTIEATFSFQSHATDTLAVDLYNQPFRDHHHKLVFRPAGHGALINNLGAIDADIVFIKNIDNVINGQAEEVAFYKKVLGGLLTELQQQIFACLRDIDRDELAGPGIESIIHFMRYSLNVDIAEDFPKYATEYKIKYIQEMLNRPIRVCGMVKNEGEPGGGPFWVRDQKGVLSLQIVEGAQIDHKDPKQAAILAQSTHFNPVDLVCGLRNYKGERFSLTDYIDHESGFIVEKTKEGRPLKAYELPGLWNGAMAKWLTVFVEVPLITFNPVKTVNDLLKAPHQP